MAKKQTRMDVDDRGGALGDFAEQVGTLLGQAEARWRTWQGSETRDAIVETMTSVRDRASALLKDMSVELPFGGKTSQGGRGAGRQPRKAAKPAGTARNAGSRAAAGRKAAGRKAAKASKASGTNRTAARARR